MILAHHLELGHGAFWNPFWVSTGYIDGILAIGQTLFSILLSAKLFILYWGMADLCQQSPFSQTYGFSRSHVWIWELDCKESWAPKNWFFWTAVLEETIESPLACKEIQPVHPKGNQSWIFIGRTDAKAKTPILWPPDAKNWLIGKDPDAGKDWRQEKKGMTEDEMVGWHHQLNGHEFG